MSELRYKSIDDVPKVIALGGTIPAQRFEHDVTNEALGVDDSHDQPHVTERLRVIVKDVCDKWDAIILDRCNQNGPYLLVETMHRRIVTGPVEVTDKISGFKQHRDLPDDVACRIEWQIGVYREAL